MKTTTRRGSWRQVAPGQYAKNIGTYGDVKFGATARVSFVPFQTCEILDGNGVHVATPSPSDAKKFITAAKKVYTKDTKAEADRLQKRSSVRTPTVTTVPKWKPAAYSAPPGGHKGASLVERSGTLPGIHSSIRFLKSEIRAMEHMVSTDPANAPEYRKRASGLRARIKKLQA